MDTLFSAKIFLFGLTNQNQRLKKFYYERATSTSNQTNRKGIGIQCCLSHFVFTAVFIPFH